MANVDAVIPTQARMTGFTSTEASAGTKLSSLAQQFGLSVDLLASLNGIKLSKKDYTFSQNTTLKVATLVEDGGGDLKVAAGANLNAGDYYVERGNGMLSVAGSIITNPGRDTMFPTITTQFGSPQPSSDPNAFLPTTLFLGKGNFTVQAGGDITLGPVANAFLIPQGLGNGVPYGTYFSTYAPTDLVKITSLSGNVVLREEGTTPSSGSASPILLNMMLQFSGANSSSQLAYYEPWIRTTEINDIPLLGSLISLAPPSLEVNALGGGITIQGNLTMAPSPVGNLSLLAAQSISGYAPTGVVASTGPSAGMVYASATVNLSDADPSKVASIVSPR